VNTSDKDAKKAVTVTIDDFMDKKGVDKIDFIKMDIEGAELPALKGAEKPCANIVRVWLYVYITMLIPIY
jgi:FkbM family methyltransferase